MPEPRPGLQSAHGDLPTQLGQLSELRRLLLAYNQLTVLPEMLTQLRRPELLDLSHNRLTDRPAPAP